MAHGTRTVCPGKQNKGLSSTFQQSEKGWSIQWPKCCDKHGNKDEDNCPKNVNNVHNLYLFFQTQTASSIKAAWSFRSFQNFPLNLWS